MKYCILSIRKTFFVEIQITKIILLVSIISLFKLKALNFYDVDKNEMSLNSGKTINLSDLHRKALL